MSKSQDVQKQIKCPLTKEQQRQLMKIADQVQKHKDIVRKLSPLHL
jgi:hypothetical protein